MILTLISPQGERWSVDPAPEDTSAWVETLPVEKALAMRPLQMLQGRTPPKGRALVAHVTTTGWQAILSDP